MSLARNRLYPSKIFKKEAIKIAKELHYSKDVIEKLEKAQNEDEASRILSEARRESYERQLKNMSKR